MRKNSVYLSSPAIYEAAIEDCGGVAQFTKKFDQFQNAFDWCVGMCKEEGYAFKLSDIDTKKVLESGRFMKGAIVPYEIEAEKPEPVSIDGMNPVIDKGIKTELEHRDLIVKMLTEAGKEATEEKILAIAEEIAKVHTKEDPQYYEKLERMEVA